VAVTEKKSTKVSLSRRLHCLLKGRVHCFTMQVVMNKLVFLQNPEIQFGADSSARFQEKRKNRTI